MQKAVRRIISDIKSLRIQGARNIARAALRGIALEIKASKARSLSALYKELQQTAVALASARPTEPMLRNTINDVSRFAFFQIKKDAKTVAQAKQLIVKKEEELLKRMEDDVKRLTEYGAKLIPEGATVMTYCHSSTVTGILKRAHEIKKGISIIACETRPLFQGRITAHELAEANIPVRLIVDSAMNAFMKNVDICIVGADAVTSRGDLINKIGTSTLAHIARFHDVSFYSAAELYKYSPLTVFGQLERIEERAPDEIWPRAPKGVVISNPAFDATAARYISGYITEVGVLPPQSLFAIATEKLGVKIYE